MSSSNNCASQVTVDYLMEGNSEYLSKVSDLVVGNMVDPITGNYWAGPFNNNPWTWENNGSNCKEFALMGNYKYDATEETALSKVVINPAAFGPGAHNVTVVLCTAAVNGDKSNTILRLKSATVDGEPQPTKAFINEWRTSKDQPSSEFYDCKLVTG